MTETPARRDFRHTKIICTLGPASSSEEMLTEMATAGMNIARLNMSHGNHESHGALIAKIKKLNGTLNHPIALLLDTKGPEIRTGAREAPLELEDNAKVIISVDPKEKDSKDKIYVSYPDLVQLHPGDRITLDNGIVNVDVEKVEGSELHCRVADGGTIGSRRHVNLPGVRVNLPSITEQDHKDILFGIAQDVDYIALSFVRHPDDIRKCRKILADAGKPDIRIYAKIENHEGVDLFDEILDEADGIMVARGDLGVEIAIRDLPVQQRHMVKACALKGKPVIVATHLLESMITNPTPTRAEVSDVANAVYEGADAIMLSGETSTGDHPARCVRIMASIATRMEKEEPLGFHLERPCSTVGEHLARSACRLADSLGTRAIVVTSHTGRLVEAVASFRPRTAIIYGFTDEHSTLRKLWGLRSVVPLMTEFNEDEPEVAVHRAMRELQKRNRLLPGDPVVVVSDIKAGPERIEALQVRTFDVV